MATWPSDRRGRDCSPPPDRRGHVASSYVPAALGGSVVGFRARRNTSTGGRGRRVIASSHFKQTAPQFAGLLQTIAERNEAQGEVSRKIPFCQVFPETKKILRNALKKGERPSLERNPSMLHQITQTTKRIMRGPHKFPFPSGPPPRRACPFFRLRRRRTGTEGSRCTVVAYKGHGNPL